MEQLPYIDEYSTSTGAPPDRVWVALAEVLRKEFGGAAGIARALGCDPAAGTPEFDGSLGQTVPGFRVAESEPQRRLALRGQHRFSRYGLTFVLDGDRLSAQTHAVFPGLHGRLYRLAVIGTRGHRVVTKRLLAQVVRRAGREREEVGSRSA
ncbi:hypothetical protein [Conexibacter woesei]|uniref:DUF2867 domain-containing protein n=1 Tax=Conexibacter woesei (strain DSM 14684 / CCUG 47730 / CIP 108061 / JCM 11494 / NBRC 100937 / ID131577) TaxID=469383 RepID=D3EZ28_CONWI|nr:hypothetical protein [Conexibacter woesei]ADB49902.1 hypothetical protein Cwoe_1474 [Conexibacter woesei DSM 14684]